MYAGGSCSDAKPSWDNYSGVLSQNEKQGFAQCCALYLSGILQTSYFGKKFRTKFFGEMAFAK